MSGERGSVAVVAVALVAVVAVLTAALGASARITAAREMAQTAADAAALAAAPVTFRPFGGGFDPVEEAARVAARNGGRLVACTGCDVDVGWRRRVVEVLVLVEAEVPGRGRVEVTATAAAEFVPLQLLQSP